MIFFIVLVAAIFVSSIAEYDANFIRELLKDAIHPIKSEDYFQSSYSVFSFAKSALSYKKTPSASSITSQFLTGYAIDDISYLNSSIAIRPENDRKLDVTFTCQSFSGFSPFSQCSDIVDYSFVVPTGSSQSTLEMAVRAALMFTEMPFIDNLCLADYKRMRCAQIYTPCVTDGTCNCFYSVFLYDESWCRL
jgi:hypothetical protein